MLSTCNCIETNMHCEELVPMSVEQIHDHGEKPMRAIRSLAIDMKLIPTFKKLIQYITLQ